MPATCNNWFTGKACKMIRNSSECIMVSRSNLNFCRHFLAFVRAIHQSIHLHHYSLASKHARWIWMGSEVHYCFAIRTPPRTYTYFDTAFVCVVHQSSSLFACISMLEWIWGLLLQRAYSHITTIKFCVWTLLAAARVVQSEIPWWLLHKPFLDGCKPPSTGFPSSNGFSHLTNSWL